MIDITTLSTPKGPWVWEREANPGAVAVHTLKGPDILCRWWEAGAFHSEGPPLDAASIAAFPELIAEVQRLRNALKIIATLRPEDYGRGTLYAGNVLRGDR